MKKLFTAVLVLYVLGIIVLTVLPNFSSGRYDKVLHTVEFYFLTLLMLKTLSLYRLKYNVFITGIMVTVIAVASEYMQLLIPTRTFNYWDMAVNFAGMAMAYGAYIMFSDEFANLMMEKDISGK